MDRWTQYLFEGHSEMELRAWARRLKLFRFFRAYGGHANDGDSLDMAFAYKGEGQLESFFAKLGIELVKFDVQPPQAEIGVSYKGSMLARFPSLIRGTTWLKQPGHCEIAGVKVFIWCDAEKIKISLGDPYEVTEKNVSDAEKVEAVLALIPFDRVDPPHDTRNYISPKHYPDYFEESIHFAGLTLRPYSDLDAEEFTSAVLESVESVGRWMSWCSADYSIDRALEWFADCRNKQAAGSAYEYGIFCQATGKFLGGAGLNEIRPQHKFCNLGYWIRQSEQRKGIASRCVKALSTQAFRELGLHRVEIVVAVGNVASEGVAIKSGALRESIARNRLYIHGKPVSAHIFSLVPSRLAAPD